MKGLRGKIALVVGGSRGIGRSVAEKLAHYGATVIIGSRTEAELNQTLKEMQEHGLTAYAFPLDVAERKSVQHFVDQAWKVEQRIDILVNSAGVNTRLPAEEYPEEAWERVVNINLTGSFRTCQEVGMRMIQQREGTIVNITSMMSHVVTPNQSAYSASKAGLLQYTRQLAVEWATYNIRVNAVSPGYIETELNAAARAQASFHEHVLQKTPQARYGTTEEVAEAVCFLASPAASFINGAYLPVDGGFLAGHPAIIARTD